jgi:hypothetical protein
MLHFASSIHKCRSFIRVKALRCYTTRAIMLVWKVGCGANRLFRCSSPRCIDGQATGHALWPITRPKRMQVLAALHSAQAAGNTGVHVRVQEPRTSSDGMDVRSRPLLAAGLIFGATLIPDQVAAHCEFGRLTDTVYVTATPPSWRQWRSTYRDWPCRSPTIIVPSPACEPCVPMRPGALAPS